MAVPKNPRELRDWEPTHMARQLPDGTWSSKLGPNEDITHFTLDALESYGRAHGARDEYGCDVLYLKRFVVVSWIVHSIQLIQWRIEHIMER